jgi:hypothetical protein
MHIVRVCARKVRKECGPFHQTWIHTTLNPLEKSRLHPRVGVEADIAFFLFYCGGISCCKMLLLHLEFVLYVRVKILLEGIRFIFFFFSASITQHSGPRADVMRPSLYMYVSLTNILAVYLDKTGHNNCMNDIVVIIFRVKKNKLWNMWHTFYYSYVVEKLSRSAEVYRLHMRVV